jgi:hypothetical protein
MTTPQKPLPHVQPFLTPPEKPPRKKFVDMRGMLSIGTMVVSLAALTVSMFGATIFVLDVFRDGLDKSLDKDLDGVLVKLVVLGLAFLFGWGVGLVSIRGFKNLVYPLIIQIYTWACVFAIGVLYMKIIQKLYIQEYTAMRFWIYLLMLLGGLFVLICLHLLVEDHDLRPFAIPLLIISVLQLFVIIFRYVFDGSPKGILVFADLTVFVVMTSISALMLAHIGILEFLRYLIAELFSGWQAPGNHGNGGT